MTTKLMIKTNRQLWLAAIKPPMYSVAIMPIIIGTATAWFDTNIFQETVFFTFLAAAVLILAWENLSNDVFDSETGIDKNKAHSVVNLTGNKSLVFWLGNLCLLSGITGIAAICWWQKDIMVLQLILLCCFLGYTYQGPPFRLGYQGVGEIICFICFGPIAIAAAYYSQTQTFSATSLTVSVIVGITTSLILFCSHFHQVEDDLAAGKKSPIVRLGTARGAKVLTGTTVSVFVFLLIFIGLSYLPAYCLLTLLSIPWAYQLINHVGEHHDQPEKVSNCKFIAVNFHFVSGILLALGFVLPNWLANIPLF